MSGQNTKAPGFAGGYLLHAQTKGGFWIEPIAQRADELSGRAAELLVQAHLRTEETEGAARAVRIAERGEAWVPIDRDAEFAEAFGLARSA